MSDYQIAIVLAGFAFFYSLVASKLERTPVNGAIVYVLAGILLGPCALNLINLHVRGEVIRSFAEMTLAVVLFTDSATAHLAVLRRFEAIPVRLILVGLPLTIVFGFAVGYLLFDELSFFELALLATMLAPTDAALGEAVVTNPDVPISVRDSLNVESGLNDGVCVPVVLLLLALSRGNVEGWDTVTLLARLPIQAIGIGTAVGLALGFLGSLAVRLSSQRQWSSGSWHGIPVVALAVLCFAVSQSLGGSGFIGSFIGGLIFGAFARQHKHEKLEAAEGVGNLLALLTWFVYGTVLFQAPFNLFSGSMIVYAVASLTVVRMIPVYLAVSRLKLRTDTTLFLGWFGPRGMASVVFAVMVAGESLPGGNRLLATTAWTVLLSIFAHGLTANPIARWYGKRVGDAPV